MARTDYGAIQNTVIKDTSDSIREVNGTSALIAPSAWGAQIRTMVSGSKYQQTLDNFPVITIPQTPIASFDDGAGNVPFKEILAYIQATQAGTGDPSPINPREISGVSSVDTTRTGKNLFDKTNYASYAGYIQGGVIYSNPGHLIIYMPCLPNTTYTASRERTSANERFAIAWSEEIPDAGVRCTRTSQAPNSGTIGETMAVSTTTGSTAKYIVVWAWWQNSITQTARETLQLETGSTATAYEPYTGQTATTALGGTYYGGYLNVTTGLLTVDKLIKDLGTLDYTYVASGNRFTNSGSGIAGEVKAPASDSQLANIMCDKLKPMSLTALRSSSDDFLIAIGDTGRISIRWTATQDPIAFKTAITGTNLVYELTTPQTVQLTPAQIEQLLGQNNVFCSSGDVAVKYYSIGGEIPSGNPVTILEDGVVSANGSYQVATFDDISDFGIIAVSLNDGGTEHPDCVCTTVQSIIDNGGTINLPAGFNDMRVELTLTSVTLTWYSGSWRTVTADIKGWR